VNELSEVGGKEKSYLPTICQHRRVGGKGKELGVVPVGKKGLEDVEDLSIRKKEKRDDWVWGGGPAPTIQEQLHESKLR